MASFNHIDWCPSFGPYLADDCECPCPCEWDAYCTRHDTNVIPFPTVDKDEMAG